MQTKEYCTLKKTNYEKQPYRYEGDPLRICCMHGFDMLPPPKLEAARMLFSSHRDRDFSGYFWRRYFRICCVLLPSLPVYNNCATLTEDKKLSYRRETARLVMSVEICQLPRNSAETTCTTSPEQIEVMQLKRYSKAMCNKHVHSTMTRWSRFRCPVGVINKPTTVELWISPVYRRLAVAKFSKSTM